jgi:hypothetical protein
VTPPRPWAAGGARGVELSRRGEAEAGAGRAVDDGDEGAGHAVMMELKRSEARARGRQTSGSHNLPIA